MYGRRALEYHQSVPQAIRTILSSNRLYFQALLSGIANYTALAQKIKPEIDEITGVEVQIGTIVVAIKRFSDALIKEKEDEEQAKSNNSNRLEGARMSLTGSIIDIGFIDKEFDEIFDMLDEVFENESSGNFNLIQTNKQLTLFAEDIEEIRDIVSTASKRFDGKIKEGLSKITITLPDPSDNKQQQNPDYNNMLSLVSDIVHNHQIPLHNAFFAPTETVLILKDKDAAKAYELLRAKLTT